MKVEIKISGEFSQWSIRRYVRTQFPHLSQEAIHKAIRTGDIRINGAKVKIDHIINQNDIIMIWDKLLIPLEKQVISSAKEYAFLKNHIIAKNSDFWCFSKPAGLAVQGGTGLKTSLSYLSTGLMHDELSNKKADVQKIDTSTDYTEVFGKDSAESVSKPYVVHRLDRFTSGICLMATNPITASELGKLFAQRSIKKHYLAVCEKPADYDDTNSSTFALKGIIKDRIEDREAITEYVVESIDQNYAVISFYPVTGRKHQIRLHASKYLWPIVGDKLYNPLANDESENDIIDQNIKKLNNKNGSNKHIEKNLPKNMLLHAYSVKFSYKGKEYNFEAPVPDYFRKYL